MRGNSSVLALLLVNALAVPAGAEETTLHLLGGRFAVAAHYRTPTGEGEGRAVAQSSRSGYFWFFSPDSVEVLVKVVDGCELSQSFWLYAAGMTDVEVTLQVTDTWADETRTYTNPLGHSFAAIQDTSAFSTCSARRRCGQGTAAEIAATPRADRDAEWIALWLGGGLTAPEALYQRVAADLAAIHLANAETVAIRFTPKCTPYDFMFEMTEEAFALAMSGEYHEWDCLNQWYGQTELYLGYGGGHMAFRGAFDMKRVTADYDRLPGITSVMLDPFFEPLPIPYYRLCAWPDGIAIHYFFHKGTTGAGFWEYITDAPGSAPREVVPDEALFWRCRLGFSF